jgi:hypothetical protein
MEIGFVKKIWWLNGTASGISRSNSFIFLLETDLESLLRWKRSDFRRRQGSFLSQ